MQLGVHVSNFTYDGGPAQLGSDLTRIATAADELGFAKISVMDHVFQIFSRPELDMLEAYTALGFIAACTNRIKLLAWVTAVSYREPGLLVKAVTTLDVLSGGRAYLGIGAAWNGEEAEGLGLFFPPLSERYERLEETLQIALQMWSGNEASYDGKHYHLARTLNSPQALSKPHPPILIGGGGEKKTLRLVAQYAQACNLFYTPELAHKLDVLRGHCETLGRDYDEIEKTVMMPLDVGQDGSNVDSILEAARGMAELGITHVHGSIPGVATIKPLEILADKVMPEVAKL